MVVVAQRFGDSISPIDYYNVSPNLSHLVPPPTPKSYRSVYNRRNVQITPRIGEKPPENSNRKPLRRHDSAYYQVRRPRYPKPNDWQNVQMNEALGPQLAQQFLDLDELRNRNQQRIGYLQL